MEEIQRESMRAITGGIRGTNHARSYEECGWFDTHERRSRKNLTTFYKMVKQLTPEYMSSLIPKKTQDRTTYNLRSSQELSQPTARTTLYQNSFIPFTLKVWNNLQEAKNSTNLLAFKSWLNKHDTRIPRHYYSGKQGGTNIPHQDEIKM